jgi:hypothetical protein
VREAEQTPLLEAVSKERLVKTGGWKRLSGCCCDLFSTEISDSAAIIRMYVCMYVCM